MDDIIKTVISLFVLFLMVIAPLLKKILERTKGKMPQPRRPAGAEQSGPAEDLRDFMRKLEELAKDEEPASPQSSPPRKPVVVPARRPVLSQKPRSPQRLAEAPAMVSVRSQARLAQAPAMKAVRAQPSGAVTAQRALSRLPLVSAAAKGDLGALFIWSEIFGKSRAARPWRTPRVVGR